MVVQVSKREYAALSKGKPIASGRNKYGAKLTLYNGVAYHSKREADYAVSLNVRKECGEIESWRRQVRLRLLAYGIHICDHIVDFEVIYPTGRREFVEIKGYETKEYKLKRKLVEAQFFSTKYTVVK